MPDPQQHRPRRWYQFSLRTLLIATALAAGLAFAWAKCVEPYRLQRETMAAITKLGGSYKSEDATGWVRYLDGHAQNVSVVDLANCDKPDEYMQYLARLPRLKTLVIGGHSVGDEQAAALVRLVSLKGLVLDSTLVSEEGVNGLKEKVPELVVCKSQRRACAELEKLGAQLLDCDIYDHMQRATLGSDETPPSWLRDEAGEDFFVRHPVVFDLARRRVSSPTLAWLTTLTHLRAVYLMQIDIEGVVADTVMLPSLTRLYLYNTPTTDASLAYIVQCATLADLDLDGTDITDEGLVHIAGLTHLTLLTLCRTRISDTGLKCLQGLQRITYFDAVDTNMGNTGLAIIAAMPHLEHLNVSGTCVTDDGIAYLKGKTTLKRAWFVETHITDHAVDVLESCKGLTDLNVERTGISASGVRRLKAALPACDVRHSLTEK